MFQKLLNAFLIASVATLLGACSGDQAAFDAQPAPVSAASPLSTIVAPAPVSMQGSVAATPPAASVPAVLQPVQYVTESERVAEELRLVDYEQSYSIEMNRRAHEQAEREQRAAITAQAGVVQGPGCEGTEGHAALECERSII